MKKSLHFWTCVSILFSVFCSATVYGQGALKKRVPSNAELIALVNRYVHTPVTRTVRSNGDVFLQRDLSPYLHGTLFSSNESAAPASDFGHDHKDAMLEQFLNRPQPSVSTLARYFREAAIEFRVPVELLMADGQVQSNWAQVSESMYGSWGVMGIIENIHMHQLSSAAALLQVSIDSIKNDARTNIRAAAALLASYQRSRGAATSLQDWFASVKDLTGLRDEAMKSELATRIYSLINDGSKTVTLWGEIIDMAAQAINVPEENRQSIQPANPNPTDQRITSTDYPGAIENYTTCNFGSRPAGSTIDFYFVHYVGTGTYQGAISWFKDCTSQVSAHYVIRNSDGQVSQVVAEADRAFSQGVSLYNNQGISTEHEVIATNLSMWDSEPMLVAAGKLAANVCDRRAIPKVRRVNNGDRGIYGHSDVRVTDCPNMTQARWDAFMAHVLSATASVGTPVLYSIANPGTSNIITATWKANTDPTLLGYRLYYSSNDALTNWVLAANETTLTAASTSVTLDPANFIDPPTGDVYHFKLTAVITDGTNPVIESSGSDIYSRSSNTTGKKVLIVDGFDRLNGSYTQPTHSFVTSYFKGLRDRESLQISSAANERVEDGTILLSNYDIVVWFVGDESSANVVFSTLEKAKITAYLAGGGKMLISGSEIAYNIGRSASATYDLSFMNNYLKSTYVGDGAVTYTPATGIAGTDFAGLNIPFGIVYPEDFPDDVAAFGGAANIFNYAVAGKRGGVAYKGTFGAGTVPGAMIFLSFTLETASDISISAFMEKALSYYSTSLTPVAPTTNADMATAQSGAAKRVAVLANDVTNGTPINPATVVVSTSPVNGTVVIESNGDITYTSNAGFTGTDNFQYKVQNTSALLSAAATVTITVIAASDCNSVSPETDDLNPKRDLRGAWVSTVSNIDWPSSRTLSTAQQQAELIKILDTLNATGINSIFLQVRPESDALYASAIDPWSYWLTNAQGTPPNPFWDPLQFAVQQTHARGMEIHAWINPYRAKQSTPVLAANHVANLHPDWTFLSGTTVLLNPGLPAVRTYVTNVVADIATRYDVDGIHFDDYFYPYAGMTGQDTATYTANNPNGIATIEDWRRNNVNQLIAMVYDTLQLINGAANRNVIFGVSPFGIWKSGVPAGISGTSSYSAVYCDPIAWLQAGKVDYLAPQLYWKITGAQDYLALSKWWNDQAALNGRHVYPGLALYKMNDANNWDPTEIQNQVLINRSASHNSVLGQIMFSTQQLMADSKGIRGVLKTNQYKYKSFAPAMPWKDATCPNGPLNLRYDADSLKWDAPPAATDGDTAIKYVVYRFSNTAEALSHTNDGTKVYAIVAGKKAVVPQSDRGFAFMVTSLDKNNNESAASLAVILPVSGLTVKANLAGNKGIVYWSTLSEVNTSRFEVEKSGDGIHFTIMAITAAAGNSSLLREYQATDNQLADGINYYRVRVIDKDGSGRYSPIVTLLYRPSKATIVIAPNPFTNVIRLANISKINAIALLDATGRLVWSGSNNNNSNLEISVSQLPPGVYHLRLTDTNGKVVSSRLVKSK